MAEALQDFVDREEKGSLEKALDRALKDVQRAMSLRMAARCSTPSLTSLLLTLDPPSIALFALALPPQPTPCARSVQLATAAVSGWP